MLLPFFQWCEASWIGQTISGSVYLFPVVEAVHLLALAVIGGAVLVVDMRLAGIGLNHQPTSRIGRDAYPWLVWSLITMLVSGYMLMCSEAMRCYYNGAFWLKMWSLLFAVIFTFTVRQWFIKKDGDANRPMMGKIVALVSVVLWSGVGIGGRFIGFY